MSFNAIHENKITAKISAFTVTLVYWKPLNADFGQQGEDPDEMHRM